MSERLVYDFTITLSEEEPQVTYRVVFDPAVTPEMASPEGDPIDLLNYGPLYSEVRLAGQRFFFTEAQMTVADALDVPANRQDGETLFADGFRIDSGDTAFDTFGDPLPLDTTDAFDVFLNIGQPFEPGGDPTILSGRAPRTIDLDAFGVTTARLGLTDGDVFTTDVEVEVQSFDALSVEEAREVAYLYETGLDRDGDIDLGGLNFWIDERENGLRAINPNGNDQGTLAQFFIDSPEFDDVLEREGFAELSDASDLDLVQLLYRNVLGREGEQEGVDFWTDVLTRDGNSRTDLLYFFAIAPENTAAIPFVEDTLNESVPGFWSFDAVA